jgi:uncharacterized repeat protein (TIGR01451 family)
MLAVLGGFALIGSWHYVVMRAQDSTQTAYASEPGSQELTIVTPAYTGTCTIYNGIVTGAYYSGCDYTDLEVKKTVNENRPNEGDTIVYTAKVTNNGPFPATRVQLLDRLPAGVTYITSTASQGVFVSPLWSIGSLTDTADATLAITVTVDRGTGGKIITNTARLSADQPDPTPGNNEDEVIIAPLPTTFRFHLPIVIRSYAPCRFYDFSLHEGDWPEYYEDRYTIFGYVNQKYRILAKDASRTHLAWPAGKYENYRIRAKVKWFDNASVGAKYGLTFAIAGDLSSFYTFMVYPITQAYEIKYYNGTWSTLTSGSSSAITSGLASNYLTVERLNGRINIAVNGAPLRSIKATQISGQRHVGIGVGPYQKSRSNHNAEARFDDYEVCPLGGGSSNPEVASAAGLQGGSVPGDQASDAPPQDDTQ